MAYSEMTLDELELEIRALEEESNQLQLKKKELKEEQLRIQERIEEVQKWWESKRPPSDPHLVQSIGG